MQIAPAGCDQAGLCHEEQIPGGHHYAVHVQVGRDGPDREQAAEVERRSKSGEHNQQHRSRGAQEEPAWAAGNDTAPFSCGSGDGKVSHGRFSCWGDKALDCRATPVPAIAGL